MKNRCPKTARVGDLVAFSDSTYPRGRGFVSAVRPDDEMFPLSVEIACFRFWPIRGSEIVEVIPRKDVAEVHAGPRTM